MKTSFGILVIHNDPVPEAEIWSSVGSGTQVNTARFWTPRPFGTEFTGLDLDQLLSEYAVDTAARQLGELRVDALGYCFTSSSVFGGCEFDQLFAERVGEITGGIPVVTAGQAIREELSECEAEKVAILCPPWFSDTTVKYVSEYLPVPVQQAIRFELPPEWDGIDRPDLFDLGAVHAVRQDELERQIIDQLEPGSETLVIPGSGFPSLEAARRLYRSRGLRVVSANSALLQAMYRRVPG